MSPSDMIEAMKGLDRADRELDQVIEILRKASTYLVFAELDRLLKDDFLHLPARFSARVEPISRLLLIAPFAYYKVTANRTKCRPAPGRDMVMRNGIHRVFKEKCQIYSVGRSGDSCSDRASKPLSASSLGS